MADNKVNSGLLEFSEDQKVFVALDAETSEVKKAVTIDGDGVETDIQGVQPSGKKEITSTAEVDVASYATAQVVDEDLVAGNIKKDVDILGVVGSYEGGGSSDFSTAEVSITNSGFENTPVYIPVTYDGEDSYSISKVTVNAGATITLPAILYKGKCIALIPNALNIQVTGNAEVDGDAVIITGDCTITLGGGLS